MWWCLTTEVSEHFLSWAFTLLLIQEHILLTIILKLSYYCDAWGFLCCYTVKSQSLNFERSAAFLLNDYHLVAISCNSMSSWPENPDRVWRFYWGANWTWSDHWCSLHIPLGQSACWKQPGGHLGTLSRYRVSKKTSTLQYTDATLNLHCIVLLEFTLAFSCLWDEEQQLHCLNIETFPL